MSKYNRITIFGRPGSGKSTFAYALSQKLSLPVYYLDKYFFIYNWQKQDYEKFLSIQQSRVDEDKWIIDGNNTRSLEMRYRRADLVLYFNYPRWLCYLRLLKRRFYKNKNIDDRADGCKEQASLELLQYMWSFEHRVRGILRDFTIKYPNIPMIEVNDDKQLNKLLSKL